MSQVDESKKKNKKGISALFIPAGLFIGMGIGFAVSNLVPSMFIGLGSGFVLFALVMLIARD